MVLCKSSISSMKNHTGRLRHFSSLLISHYGFVVFHITDSAAGTGAIVRGRNSVTGLLMKATALVTPDKACSGTGCGSCEQVRLCV